MKFDQLYVRSIRNINLFRNKKFVDLDFADSIYLFYSTISFFSLFRRNCKRKIDKSNTKIFNIVSRNYAQYIYEIDLEFYIEIDNNNKIENNIAMYNKCDRELSIAKIKILHITTIFLLLLFLKNIQIFTQSIISSQNSFSNKSF